MTGREVVRSFLEVQEVAEAIGQENVDKLLAMVQDPPIAPHAVKVKDGIVEIAGERGKPGTNHRAYVGPEHCPDCGRGLVSLGGDLFRCAQLTEANAAEIADQHRDKIAKAGAVLIACGRKD